MAKRKKSSKSKRSLKDKKIIQEAKKKSIEKRMNRESIMEVLSASSSGVKSRLKNILVMDRALK